MNSNAISSLLLLLTIALQPVFAATNYKQLAFRSSAITPPAGYKGPLFKLNHAYPKSKPSACSKKACPWLYIDIDFHTKHPKWQQGFARYSKALLNYVKRGQPLNSGPVFNIRVNNKLEWFHAPWMAINKRWGREYMHGMTATIAVTKANFLGPTDAINAAWKGEYLPKQWYSSYQIGLFNHYAAYTLHQIWGHDGQAKYITVNGKKRVAGLPFMPGSVLVKLIYTTANAKDIPYLKGAPETTIAGLVNIKNAKKVTLSTCQRHPVKVYLTSLYIAAYDKRSPTGVVFANYKYIYNKNAKNIWDNLYSVGMQWGPDTGALPEGDIPIFQSITTKVPAYSHLGCDGRLTGTVESTVSSCLNCHATSSVGKKIPALFSWKLCSKDKKDLAFNKLYFSFVKYDKSFYNNHFPEAIPLDYSLQLQSGLMNYQDVQKGRLKQASSCRVKPLPVL